MTDQTMTQAIIRDVLSRFSALHDRHLGSNRFAKRSLTLRQLLHFQETLGSALPDSLLATWGDAAVMGAMGTVGAFPGIYQFFDPIETLREWHVYTAVVYGLRQGRGLQHEATLAADQQIRHDVFNKGWFPIGLASGSYRWVCVDLVPEPAGQWGQLIEVQPFHAKQTEPVDPEKMRVLAPSWLAFLESVVQVWESGRISRCESVREWRAINSESEVSPQSFIALANASSDTPAPWWRTESVPQINLAPPANTSPNAATMTDEALVALANSSIGNAEAAPKLYAREADILSRIPFQPHSNRDTDVSDVLNALMRWARSPASVSTGLLVGVLGSGRTSILRTLATRLLSKGASAKPAPVPLLVDLWSCAHTATLQEALDDWVYRQSGQTRQGAAVLSAVEQGRCLLLLDNAEALMLHDHDAWTWCAAAVPLHTPTDVALRTGARLLVSCASEAVPAPADVAQALGTLTPGWSDVDALGFALKDMDIAWDSDRVGAFVKAKLGHKKRMERVDEFLSALSAAASPPLGRGTWSWTWRPAWLDCVFNPALARELGTVGTRHAAMRGLMHAWPNWFERRCVSLAGGLSAEQLHTLALDIALQLWDAEKSAAAQGAQRHLALPVQHVVDCLVALKPQDAATQQRVGWQVRLSLGLTPMGADRLSLSTYSMHLSVIFNALTQAVRQRDWERVRQLLSRHPLSDREREAVVCAWGVEAATPWSDAMARLLADDPCDLLRLNLSLIAEYWHNQVRQQEAYPENGVVPVLGPIQALLGPFQGAGRDFSGEDFSGRDLRDAHFEGARLNGCRFDGACLEGANLRNAQATDASFRHVKAKGMQAQGIQASGSRWYFAELHGADFSGARLCNSHFTNIKGSGCCIEGADLDLALLDASAAEAMLPRPHHSLLMPSGPLEPQWRRAVPSEYADVVFSCSGRALVTTDMSGGISIWHSGSGIRARTWVDADVSSHAVFMPCERRLLTANQAGEVKIWHVLGGTCLQRWQAHEQPIHAMALSPCGQWLATSDLAGHLRCWNVSDGTLLAQMHILERQVDRLLCGAEQGSVWVCFADGGASLCDCVKQVENGLTALGSKRVMALAGEAVSPTALVVHPAGVDVCRLSDQGMQILQSHTAAGGFVLSPDGGRLLMVPGDQPPQVQRLADGLTQRLPQAQREVQIAAFSPDGSHLVLIGPRHMQWLDAQSGKMCFTREVGYEERRHAGWHWLPDGMRIATHEHATIVDAVDGLSLKPRDPRIRARGHSMSAGFGVHPNGRGVLAITDYRSDPSAADCPITDLSARMFDQRASRLSNPAISQDGRHVALELGRELGVWSLFDPNGEELAIAPHASCEPSKSPELADIFQQGDFRSTALANGGDLLAYGLRDGEVVLIDMPTGRQRLRWQAHAGQVAAICFIDGGKRILSFCGRGESVCSLWNAANGELLNAWLWPHAAPLTVQVGPTGDVLVQADVAVVVDGAGLRAPHAEWKTRFSCKVGQDGSLMTLHADGRYSASGPLPFYLDLIYQGAGGLDAVGPDVWPRVWSAQEVVDQRRQCDPESMKEAHRTPQISL